MVRNRAEDPDLPQLRRLQEGRKREVDEIVAAVAAHFGADRERWRVGHRSDDIARAAAAHASRRLTGESTATIAEAVGYRRSQSVSVACRRVERALTGRSFAREMKKVMARLTTTA